MFPLKSFKLRITKMIHFEVVSKLGKKISTTKEYWEFIVTLKHPMMEGKEKAVQGELVWKK